MESDIEPEDALLLKPHDCAAAATLPPNWLEWHPVVLLAEPSLLRWPSPAAKGLKEV